MNTRAKGTRNRKKTLDHLTAQGWLVGVVERTGRFIFPKDLFSLFDICCIKKNKVLFVQVATNRPHTHKVYKAFRKKVCCKKYILIEQWCWYDYKKKPKITIY